MPTDWMKVYSSRRGTSNAKLLDASIERAFFDTRLTQREANRLLKLLNKEILPELRKKYLEAAKRMDPKSYSLRRLKLKLKYFNDLAKKNIYSTASGWSKDLLGMGEEAAAWAGGALESAVPVGLGFTSSLPTISTLRTAINSNPFLGKTMKGWFKNLSRAAIRNYTDAVHIGMVNGESYSKIAARIGKAGNLTRAQARVVARTATKHALNQAKMAAYYANKDILKGWQFVAVLDSGTTDICLSMDGRIFPLVGTGGYWPPLHHQCRSEPVPVTKTAKQLGMKGKKLPPEERAALGGPISGKVDGSGWFKSQPAKIQNKMWGKKYAADFRAGRLSWDEYMNMRGLPGRGDIVSGRWKNIPARKPVPN